jgi:DNA repair exonuclease SbcCD ATPase subunit
LAISRDSLSRANQRLERLEALHRPELQTPLQTARDEHTAACNDVARVEESCKAARRRQQQFKHAASEAREGARGGERALRRVEQAEEDAERQKRQTDELLATASSDARALARGLESAKAELPELEAQLADIATAQRQLAAHTAHVDSEPDDALPLDQQLAFVSDDRTLALADVKRLAGALTGRLASAERSLRRAAATVASLAAERSRLDAQSLPLLTSELHDLRARIDTTKQWAVDYGGDDVRCDARLPDGRARELETQLLPQLLQYMASLGQTVDASSAHAARLADEIALRREAERAQRQAEAAAKEHAKSKQRELKRLLKALNAAEMQKIRDEERALRAQSRLTDAATAAHEDAQTLCGAARAVADAAMQQDSNEVQTLVQLLAQITGELASVKRAQAEHGDRPGVSAQATTSDALWSAIDARRDTLNGLKRRSAALSEKLDTLAKRLAALRKETAKLQVCRSMLLLHTERRSIFDFKGTLAQQQKSAQTFRAQLQGAPASTLNVAESTERELATARDLLSQANVALEKRDSEVNLLRGTEASNRDIDKVCFSHSKNVDAFRSYSRKL